MEIDDTADIQCQQLCELDDDDIYNGCMLIVNDTAPSRNMDGNPAFWYEVTHGDEEVRRDWIQFYRPDSNQLLEV